MTKTTIYRSELDGLTERAKQKNMRSDGLNLGEKFFVELLRCYIREYRQNELTADELNRKKQLLERDYINYKDGQKMFRHAVEITNRYSAVLIEAEKDGCPICKKLVKIFDGRET